MVPREDLQELKFFPMLRRGNFPKGDRRGPQGGLLPEDQRRLPAQKPARNVRIPKLKNFLEGGANFLKAQIPQKC